MNSLKGVGVCILLATTLLAMRQIGQTELAVLILTIVLITGSTGAYLASRHRYRKDRRIAGD